MKSFLFGLLVALTSVSAFSAPVAKQGDDTVTLLEEACPAAIQAIADSRGVPSEWTQRLGKAYVGGKYFTLCWTALPDGRVGLIYEDGDMGAIPQGAFRDDPGA